ncbi:hypothetical protein THRCLA_20676 [Thraustotheca clavata]|uniref:Uncharacterized protein n=1 Tax=Thraustotheca clavata TaxID=74557 RepID=A0A1W0A4Q2_9STRA|nr:hypothetical protein THRCLA_20676 [Thraustotheca clavata]
MSTSIMLWMAYGSLIMISYILKKMKREKSFNDADPTITAMVVMISAGPLTNLLCQILPFIELYYRLFKTLAKDEDSIESTFPVIVYSLTIGMLPVVYGFLPKCLSRRDQSQSFVSYETNDVKHSTTSNKKVEAYTNFLLIIASGDCYISFGLGNRHTSVCLSLLSCLDYTHTILTTTDLTAAVGRICFEKDEFHLLSHMKY